MKNRIFTIFLLLLLSFSAFAQERKVQNRPYIDFRRLHYGFFFGLHAQDFELANNGFVNADGEQWYADVSSYNPGFSVGVLADLRINNHLSLRLLPTLHFGEKQVVFREQNSGNRERQQVKSTYMSLPLDIKFAAERFNNYRPYIIAGVNPMIDLTVKEQRPLLVKKFDFMMEFGFGCDFYLPFFKLNPELKFCFSLMDVLEKDRKDLLDANLIKFTQSLDKAVAKMIVLSFYFE
ncbi:MAG: PorT family protein [Bacteroidaceae bacterium]|nr:PorT family protein [Bacteroidaceae bacterium]